jgi:hypothetical protein
VRACPDPCGLRHIGLTAEGAIASSISVSGQAFTIAASQLSGTNFEQFGGTSR